MQHVARWPLLLPTTRSLRARTEGAEVSRSIFAHDTHASVIIKDS